MGVRNPNTTNYVHNDEPNILNLHKAMDYLPTGEPALRVISNFQGNIVVQGGLSIASNISIDSMPEVSVFTDSGNTLAIQGTVYQGTDPWVISGNSSPNGPTNPIFIEVVDQCLKVENCTGTSLKIEGNVGVQIGSPLTTVSASNPMPVTGTVTANVTFPTSQTVNGNVGLLVGGQPLATGNPIPVDITDTCLNVQNCAGTRLNVNSNSIIMINELPVADSNPLIVNFPEGTCIPVTNCGEDGVLNVSGNITVEGVAVTVENPFPVDLRNTCIGVQNCEGTILDVNITNTCLEIQNCGEGSLSVIGQVELTLDSSPVNISNPLPVTGTVTIDNECISIQNCGEGSLSIIGMVQIQHGELPVGLSNPLSTNVLNCVSVQNCEGSTLNVSGAVNLTFGDSTVVNEENPLPTILRNTCLSVQNCEGTSLEVKLTDGVNDIGFVLNDNDGQLPNTWSLPVENFNMIWNGTSWDRMPGNAISGVSVNITNSCLSVANCADTVLNVAGDMEMFVGGSAVGADNPVPVSIPGCVSIQNCGEGSLSIIGQVELVSEGDTVTDTNPLPVTGTFEGDVSITGTNLDAFARLRVSNPYTLFDGALRYRDNPLKWSESFTVGTTTITFNTNTSTISMTHTGPGTTIRQSKQVFSYQPGKSLLVMMSFVGATPITGLNQKIGFFGEQNGVYFQTDDSTLYMVRRDYTTGVVSDIQIAQSTWNGDRLDGTGPSGYTINVSKSQIWWCDIEWLGVGSVRTGFIINGQFIVCHTFHHANILGKVYMTTATLPVRYELNTSEEGGTGTLQAICSTVISEGGYVNRSIPRAVGTSLTGRNLSDTVYRPLVCIRLKSANLDAVVVPTKFEVYGLQNAAFSYQVILNPTLTSASFVSAGTDSSVEYDISATGLTGGTVIDQGIFVGTNKGGVTSNTHEVDFSTQLGRTLANVSDIWCLAAMATTNNDDAVGTVSWQEHT